MNFRSSPVFWSLAAVTAVALVTGHAAAQKPLVRTDSVFLARDIDGSGKTDYVVRESKAGLTPSMRAYRVAVYLDAEPGTRKPSWSMAWDDEFGIDQTLGRSLTIAPGVSLLAVQWGGADADGDVLLLVQRGRVQQEITHGVDYGDGYFDITQEGGKVVVDLAPGHLELRGKPVTAGITCKETEWSAMELVFDTRVGHFTPGQARCVKPRRG